MNEHIIQMLPAENTTFLAGIYQWGIEVIKVIQKIENPALTALIKFITVFGTEALYVPVILFIFWWIDEKHGLRLGILIIISAWINAFIKDVLKQPRPFNLEPSVGLATESSYGAPSGHAQMSLTFWISTAVWLSRRWAAKVLPNKKTPGKNPGTGKPVIWAAAIFIILLIGFTRLYLGVHFPTDLLAGWFVGGIILVLWYIPGSALQKRLASAGICSRVIYSRGIRFQNICAALIALIMSSVYPKDRYLPAVFLGFCIGYTLMKKSFPFSARGEINGKKPGVPIMLLRCITGFLGMAVIYLGLRLIFPGEGSLFGSIPLWGQASPLYEIGRFIRYGLIGFWVSAGAPWIFIRMKLAALPPAANTGSQGEGS